MICISGTIIARAIRSYSPLSSRDFVVTGKERFDKLVHTNCDQGMICAQHLVQPRMEAFDDHILPTRHVKFICELRQVSSVACNQLHIDTLLYDPLIAGCTCVVSFYYRWYRCRLNTRTTSQSFEASVYTCKSFQT